jgi:predicted nucleic acid-binding protein
VQKIIIDTNILIDYANGYAKWLDDLLNSRSSNAKLILPTIVIAEYFTSTSLENNDDAEIADKTFSLFIKQDLNESIAKILGAIMRRKTYPQGAGVSDLIIASTAIYLDAELATRNKTDFAKIPNLRFFDPKKLKN